MNSEYQHPAISIVIPLYNKGEYVCAAIDSVLRQTCQDFEIVVIDDGSTDGGPRLVKEFDDPRIRLERRRNCGVSAARNGGWQLARAQLIAFLDADDEWMDDHLETLVRLRQLFPKCDLMATRYVIRTGDRDRAILLRGALPSVEGVIDDYFAVASRSDPPVFASAVAVTRRALEAVGGFPDGIAQGEDLLTWARLATLFRIAYSQKATVAFRQQHMTSGRSTRRPETFDRVGAGLVQLLPQVDASRRDSLRAYIATWHKMRGSMYLSLGERGAARREFYNARRYGHSPAIYAKSMMTVLPAEAVRRLMGAWLVCTRRPVAGVPVEML